ncbi:hypothetical protein B0J17DRAFT_725185 [Rhizoctonia solani]|nr:hypothetical protein B0J17DRAFT_725185 [Rhizoctonia solani]
MINFALLELLSDPEGLKLDDGDIVAISELFDSMTDVAHIHTFAMCSQSDTFSRTLKSLATMISNKQDGLLSNDVTIVWLTVLNHMRIDESASNVPVGQVYAFVTECVLDLPPSGPEAYGQNVALDLMQRFRTYSGWTPCHILDLAQALGRRRIITKLKQAMEQEANDTNFVIKVFAVGQVWLLIDLAIRSETIKLQGWRCLSLFVEDESLWDSPGLVTQGLEERKSALAEQYRTMLEGDSQRRHEYFEDIYDSLSKAGEMSGDS